jgi:hypothetical protein
MPKEFTKLERKQIQTQDRNGQAGPIRAGLVRYEIIDGTTPDGQTVRVLAKDPEVIPDDLAALRAMKDRLINQLDDVQEKINLVLDFKKAEAKEILDAPAEVINK